MNQEEFLNEDEAVASDSGEQEQTAYPVEFPATVATKSTENTLPISRFYDVNVRVSVELGRVEMPLGDLVQIGVGAVVELDRHVSEMVDVIAQGVRIARGEVVVVEDRYAIRITEIEDEHAIEQHGG